MLPEIDNNYYMNDKNENEQFSDDSLNEHIEEIEKIEIDGYFTMDTNKSQIINEIMDISAGKLLQNRIKDKSDFAVAEKVINRYVALILYRYRNKGILQSIHGCVSTGKEANVYYAIGNGNKEVAIKIYKTSILDYKDRRRYLEGDFRYKYWNVGRNSRRIVRKWAEKEMRNLIRLNRANINAPKAIKVESNVLLMSFLGKEGTPFFTLNTCHFSDIYLESIFIQGIDILKKLFYCCKLVHGDFSEFNLLLDINDDKPILYVIDVSQAIENTGPRAFDFLKEDINNFLLFINKRGFITPSLKTIFYLITDDTILPENCLSILKGLIDKIINQESDIDTYHNDFVFRNTYIERNLHDVANYEQDILAVMDGKPNDMPYAETTGLLETFLKKLSLCDHKLEQMSDYSSYISTLEHDLTDNDNNDDDEKLKDPNFENIKKSKETPEDKKQRRKQNKILVKEANREKRKHKMNKNLKKLLIKNSRERRH